MITTGIAGLEMATPDVCVIGAGPVGISLALELSRLGRFVLLLESGGMRASEEAQRLADAQIVDPNVHVGMDIAVQRSLGGASNLWGGRCTTFDPIDFEPRPAVPHSGWPIDMNDVAPFMPLACSYAGCGAAEFESALAGFVSDESEFRFDRIERWSRKPRFSTMYSQNAAAKLADRSAPARNRNGLRVHR